MEDQGKNSINYFICYSLLINAAQHRGFTTYQEIAQAIGMETSGNHMGQVVSKLLELVSRNEVEHDRPMLSAVAVGVDGIPGDGFYKLAKDLELLEDDQDKTSFWQAENKKVYEIWKKHYLNR
jgi:hypothetical protein